MGEREHSCLDASPETQLDCDINRSPDRY